MLPIFALNDVLNLPYIEAVAVSNAAAVILLEYVVNAWYNEFGSVPVPAVLDIVPIITFESGFMLDMPLVTDVEYKKSPLDFCALNIKGGVKLVVSSVNAPVVALVLVCFVFPRESFRLTTPSIGAPTAATPVTVVPDAAVEPPPPPPPPQAVTKINNTPVRWMSVFMM